MTDEIRAKTMTAEVQPSGQRFAVPAEMTLLQAAELAHTTKSLGFEMSNSCRNGTCRTCICLLLAGEVTYRIEWPGLSMDEKQEGYILPCVAYLTTDVVIQLPV